MDYNNLGNNILKYLAIYAFIMYLLSLIISDDQVLQKSINIMFLTVIIVAAIFELVKKKKLSFSFIVMVFIIILDLIFLL